MTRKKGSGNQARANMGSPGEIPPSLTARLRAEAEAKLAGISPPQALTRPAEEWPHELLVYQIELEMQNEALRQNQLALEESRDRYLDLFEFAPAGYLGLNPAGQIVEANLTAATMLGMERNMLLKRRFDLLVAPPDRDLWRKHFAGALWNQDIGSLDLALKRNDGSLLQAGLKCRALPSPQPTLRIALADIGPRKKAELSAAQREAEYRAATETTTDGMWMLDAEGRILAVNDAYVRRSGYSREELLAMRISDVEASESLDQVGAHFEKIRREGSDLFETRHRAKDGEIWPAEVSASYWAAAGGRYFGFLRDLTEKKRQEAEIKSLRSEMEDAMRFHVASQTVAAMAHELNQPLNALATYSEAALRMLETGKPERLKHALEGNVREAQRAGRVVHELLSFLNKGEVATAPLNLNEMVRIALSRIQENHLGVFQSRLELEPRLPLVAANRLQVEKVLVNLIQNGVEAMHGAGVQSRNIAVGVRTSADGSMAQVTVTDSGPGIDPQTLHRIFDPFFTTKAKGLGMGLAISRAIIEAHGGQLWVETEPGEGASFHFTLPFAS